LIEIYVPTPTVRIGGHVRRFVLVAQARTGGHLLVDLLNSHPNIHCDYELFLPRWRDNPLRPQFLFRKVFAFMYVERRSNLYSAELYGFKLLLNQAFFPERTLSAMHRREWRIIHLRRGNIVRQTASLLIARRTNEWHRETQGDVHRQKVLLDCGEFLEQLQRQRNITVKEDALLRKYPHLSIDYEAFCRPGGYQETSERIFEYLGLSPCVVTTKFLKIHAGSLQEYIRNYDEVVRALNGTEYRNLLDE
jgi:hypothetical protein